MDDKVEVRCPLLLGWEGAELPTLWVNQKLGLLSPQHVLWFIFPAIVLPPLKPSITPMDLMASVS